MDSMPAAVHPLTSHTMTALSDDDLQLETDSTIDDEFPINQDDAYIFSDDLEVENDDPPYHTGIALCVVSSHTSVQWMSEILQPSFRSATKGLLIQEVEKNILLVVLLVLLAFNH